MTERTKVTEQLRKDTEREREREGGGGREGEERGDGEKDLGFCLPYS